MLRLVIGRETRTGRGANHFVVATIDQSVCRLHRCAPDARLAMDAKSKLDFVLIQGEPAFPHSKNGGSERDAHFRAPTC